MYDVPPEEMMSDRVEPPRWMTTALTTIGAGLVASLLIWVATNQVFLLKDTAVMSEKLDTLTAPLTLQLSNIDSKLTLLDSDVNRFRARLRADGQNIEVLKRELEDVCVCTINLNKPEVF
jgi:hypothetical protein